LKIRINNCGFLLPNEFNTPQPCCDELGDAQEFCSTNLLFIIKGVQSLEEFLSCKSVGHSLL